MAHWWHLSWTQRHDQSQRRLNLPINPRRARTRDRLYIEEPQPVVHGVINRQTSNHRQRRRFRRRRCGWGWRHRRSCRGGHSLLREPEHPPVSIARGQVRVFAQYVGVHSERYAYPRECRGFARLPYYSCQLCTSTSVGSRDTERRQLYHQIRLGNAQDDRKIPVQFRVIANEGSCRELGVRR